MEKTTIKSHAVFDTSLGRLITDFTIDKNIHVEVKTYEKSRPSMRRRNQVRKYDAVGGAILTDLCAGLRGK